MGLETEWKDLVMGTMLVGAVLAAGGLLLWGLIVAPLRRGAMKGEDVPTSRLTILLHVQTWALVLLSVVLQSVAYRLEVHVLPNAPWPDVGPNPSQVAQFSLSQLRALAICGVLAATLFAVLARAHAPRRLRVVSWLVLSGAWIAVANRY